MKTVAQLTPKFYDNAADMIFDAAQELVLQAAQNGLILTIETAPKHPLAMGNYTQNINLRPHNKLYRHFQKLEETKEEQGVILVPPAPKKEIILP